MIWFDAEEPAGEEEAAEYAADLADPNAEPSEAEDMPDGGSESGSDAWADADPDPQPGQPKEGTGAWYRWKRHSPITEDHEWTVLQVSFWIAHMKSEFRITDTAIDEICKFIHYLLLTSGNIFPPSYHLVKAVLAVPAGVSCVRHVCDSCWQLFPELQPADYLAHRADTCTCGRHRFHVGAGGKPRPNRSVYYFDEESIIKDLISKPGVLEEIIDTREEAWDQPWTLWGSAAGRDLDRRSGYKFSNPDEGEVAILFSLGMAHLNVQVISTVIVQWACCLNCMND